MTTIGSGGSVGASFDDVGDGVRRLERRDDALGLAQQPEAVQRLVVRDRDVRGAAGVLVEGVLRADAGVVEARRRCCASPAPGPRSSCSRYELRCRAGRRGGPSTGVAAWRPVSMPSPAGLDADRASRSVVAGTGGRGRWRCCRRRRRRRRSRAAGPRLRGSAARASLPMTDWKSRTIIGYGCGPDDAADQVVGVAHVGHPVADGLVDGVLEGAAAAVDGHAPPRPAASCGRR